MIYDKPRDIRLRVFPSLHLPSDKFDGKKNAKGTKKLTDNLIPEVGSQQSVNTAVPSLSNDSVDIILQGKPTFIQEAELRNSTIIDVSRMPVIEGIPMLILPDDEPSTNNVNYKNEPPITEKEPIVALEDYITKKEQNTVEFSKETAPVSVDTNIFVNTDSITIDESTDTKKHNDSEEVSCINDDIFSEIPILKYKETPDKETSEKSITDLKEKTDNAVEKENKKQKKLQKEKEKKQHSKHLQENKAKEKEEKKLLEKQIKEEKKTKKKKAKVPAKRTHIVKIASFLLVMYVGTVMSFIIPLRPTYSESEKRELTKFPEFSTKSLLSGDYFEGINTWFADTFPFREHLMSANTFIKGLHGIDTISIHGDIESGDDIPDDEIPTAPEKPVETEPSEEEKEPPKMPTADDLKENGDPNAEKPNFKAQKLGAIIVAGDSGYEYYSFSKKLAPRFINAVDKLEEKANPTGKVYALIAPTSIDIKLNDALRADINSANQKKAIEYFNGSFKNAVAVDGIYDAERAHRDEYTYFRTDHHWTALGAYYAYEQFAIEKGVRPIPLSSYKTKTFKNFKGTFYSNSKKSRKLGKKPDYVTAYLPMNNTSCTLTFANEKTRSWDVIRDATDYSSGSKYLAFIGGDFPLITIKNHDNPTNTSCVVIKDSYGNAFVPFLIPHYSTIYVIDPRHYEKSLSSFCKDKEITDVVVMTNISVTRNSIYISAFENLLR